jgi:predicted nucleic acid-binding protein
MTTAAPFKLTECPSCGASRQGRYCTACGEKFLSHDDFELKHYLVEHLADECLHVDGKLPRTLRLLFTQPGALAVNYVAGRRQRFVGPLRLYVVLFLLHAFIMVVYGGLGASFPQRVEEIDATGVLSHLILSRPDVDWQSPEVEAHLREHGHWLSEAATLVIFLVVAAGQKLIFYRLHRRYLEHVALALNVSALYIAVIVVGELLFGAVARHRFGDFDGTLQHLAGVSVLPVYWFLAIRRFYGLRTVFSASAAIVVTAVHAAVAVSLNAIVYAILIFTA